MYRQALDRGSAPHLSVRCEHQISMVARLVRMSPGYFGGAPSGSHKMGLYELSEGWRSSTIIQDKGLYCFGAQTRPPTLRIWTDVCRQERSVVVAFDPLGGRGKNWYGFA